MICDLGQSVYFDNTNLYIIHGEDHLQQYKEEKMENLKTQNTRRKNEGMDAFDGFEEVEDIVTAGDKGTIACCRDV